MNAYLIFNFSLRKNWMQLLNVIDIDWKQDNYQLVWNTIITIVEQRSI